MANTFRIKNGLDITGNTTTTGTVDGRNLAADGTKLDGIETAATADQTLILFMFHSPDNPATILRSFDGTMYECRGVFIGSGRTVSEKPHYLRIAYNLSIGRKVIKRPFSDDQSGCFQSH